MINEGGRWINWLKLKQDIALIGLDYDTREKVQSVIDRQEPINLLERDDGKEPILETKTSVYHVSYADESGGFEKRTFTDWMCPTCGWFVGELYSGFGRWHIQGESSYCSKCGQRIDWTKPNEEEKRRYEERKAKDREEWEKKNGHKLDNMNESRRKKYGMLAEE